MSKNAHHPHHKQEPQKAATIQARKLGRRPRIFNPAVPHLSALMSVRRNLDAPPPAVNYQQKMPGNLGQMLNDKLGCCTCAAVYHGIQLWTANAGKKMVTATDQQVETIYEKFCGYNPKDPNTDQGGIEQNVLDDWLNQGVPLNDNDGPINKLMGWVEVDQRIHDDVKRTINECGFAYIGFNVPENIMEAQVVPTEWQVDRSAQIVGGHAIILGGYDSEGLNLISWGGKYRMSWEFFDTYTDEVYGLIDEEWVCNTGKTLLGMDLKELTSYMSALRHQWQRRVAQAA